MILSADLSAASIQGNIALCWVSADLARMTLTPTQCLSHDNTA